MVFTGGELKVMGIIKNIILNHKIKNITKEMEYLEKLNDIGDKVANLKKCGMTKMTVYDHDIKIVKKFFPNYQRINGRFITYDVVINDIGIGRLCIEINKIQLDLKRRYENMEKEWGE